MVQLYVNPSVKEHLQMHCSYKFMFKDELVTLHVHHHDLQQMSSQIQLQSPCCLGPVYQDC